MIRQSRRERNFLFLRNSNIICCNTVFAEVFSVSATQATVYMVEKNYKKGWWIQVSAKGKNTKPTAWLHTHAKTDSARTHHSSLASLAPEWPLSEHNFLFLVGHERRIGPVKRVGHWQLCGFCHHGMVRPQVANGEVVLQILRVAANILNKQLRTADRGFTSTLEVWRELTTTTAESVCYEMFDRSLGPCEHGDKLSGSRVT
jgi:hypothetical protein